MTVTAGFDDFVVVRSPRLLRAAYLLTLDWALAEDLLQTALARAFEAWHRMRGDPEPYVRRILVTLYTSRWRRRWARDEPADDGDPAWRALGRLPRRQRAVIVLRYFEDLPDADVAAALGCRPATVRSEAGRALARLRVDATSTPEGVLR